MAGALCAGPQLARGRLLCYTLGMGCGHDTFVGLTPNGLSQRAEIKLKCATQDGRDHS
jgi:hypothetical protein